MPLVLPEDIVIVKPIDAYPDFYPLVLNESPLGDSAPRNAFARLVQETALVAWGVGGQGRNRTTFKSVSILCPSRV